MSKQPWVALLRNSLLLAAEFVSMLLFRAHEAFLLPALVISFASGAAVLHSGRATFGARTVSGLVGVAVVASAAAGWNHAVLQERGVRQRVVVSERVHVDDGMTARWKVRLRALSGENLPGTLDADLPLGLEVDVTAAPGGDPWMEGGQPDPWTFWGVLAGGLALQTGMVTWYACHRRGRPGR
ncbi:hypothetical protein [Streptomyces sp. NPDC016626]|uniref:hypothetical protein n=1 Tax=Streptomyces sp. NPDC016626 TaxID=3364968 RepID=UPI0036F53455